MSLEIFVMCRWSEEFHEDPQSVLTHLLQRQRRRPNLVDWFRTDLPSLDESHWDVDHFKLTSPKPLPVQKMCWPVYSSLKRMDMEGISIFFWFWFWTTADCAGSILRDHDWQAWRKHKAVDWTHVGHLQGKCIPTVLSLQLQSPFFIEITFLRSTNQ